MPLAASQACSFREAARGKPRSNDGSENETARVGLSEGRPTRARVPRANSEQMRGCQKNPGWAESGSLGRRAKGDHKRSRGDTGRIRKILGEVSVM